MREGKAERISRFCAQRSPAGKSTAGPLRALLSVVCLKTESGAKPE